MKLLKDLVLFIFVFVSFNDMIATEYLGNASIKVAFGLFLITHIGELYEMFLEYKTRVVKLFLAFISITSIITIITYFVKLNLIYITDMPIVASMRILSFLVIFIYITYTKEFKKLLYMLWISMIISSIIAFFSDPYEQGTFRTVGGTENPNNFASQVMMAIFITVYLFKQNHSKIFLFSSILFFLYTMVYAGSKSAFLVLSILLFVLFIVKFKTILAYFANLRGILIVLSFVMISSGIVEYMKHDSAVKGMQERAKHSGTMQQRFIIWRAGGEIIRDNFFLGVGFGQFPKVSGGYIKNYLPPEALPAHNNFIKIFAECGVLSFVTFFAFIISLFSSYIKEIFSSDYFWIYMASLSMVLMGLTSPTLHHKDFWFTIALVSHVIYHFYKQKEKDFSEVPI